MSLPQSQRSLVTWPALRALAVMAFLVGCGRQAPAPIEVARSFTMAIERLAAGADGAALSAFGLLSTESQSTFVEQATRTNDALPPNLPRLEPHQLLRVRRAHFGPEDEFVEVERGDSRAVVEVRRGEKRARLELVKQGAAWRVSLSTPDGAASQMFLSEPHPGGDAG